MLTQDNFTKENIERLQKISGNDPLLLEKTVYAFGLLEAILYTDAEYVAIDSPEEYMNDKLSFRGARGISYLRKVNLDCYAYVAAAVRILGEGVEEVVYSFEEYLKNNSD